MVEIPWFKVDDALSMHMKAFAAGNKALGLWVRAGSWSMHQLSDGFIPKGVIPALGGDWDDAVSLINAGLWRAAEGGYQFHDWAEYQPTKEKVLAEREANRQRVEKHRANRVSNGVTNGVSKKAPSRPVPTRPLTDYVSQSDDDRQREEHANSVLRGLGINPSRLVRHLQEKTGREASVHEASGVALAILARSEDVAKPQAYVLGSITKHPDEARAMLPSLASRQAPMCSLHPYYPIPCHRCAVDADAPT